MSWELPAAMVGGSVVTGLLGANANAKAIAAQQAAAAQAVAALQAIGLPPDTAQRVVMQQYSQQGQLTPELQQAISVQAAPKMSMNQPLEQEQMKSLQSLEQQGQQGITPVQRAALAQVYNSAAQQSHGQQQQIMQNMAERRQAGSGAELAGRFAAQQNALQNSYTQGLGQAAQASQNALNAIGQAGQLSTGMQGQNLNMQQGNMQAQNAINQFNAGLASTRQAQNVGAQNQAQQYNIGVQQQLANQNTMQSNQEAQRMNQAKMDDWKAKLQQAQSISGALTGASQYAGGQDKANAQMYAGIGGALNTGLAQYGLYDQNQQALALKQQELSNQGMVANAQANYYNSMAKMPSSQQVYSDF